MASPHEHARLARENLAGARAELRAHRYSNVGLLAIRALEQGVEAAASKVGIHYHMHPPTAHRKRREWLAAHHRDLVELWDQLWAVYGELGYGGVDGERAREATRLAARAVRMVEERERLAAP